MRKVAKTAFVREYQLPIEIIKDGEYFVARSPRWTECYAQGRTIDEATAEIIAVAASLIELYEEEGLKIPLSESEKQSTKKISFNVPVFSPS